jgi:hypothetical protein
MVTWQRERERIGVVEVMVKLVKALVWFCLGIRDWITEQVIVSRFVYKGLSLSFSQNVFMFLLIWFFHTFGSAITRINFDRIDSVKLILVKIDFKLKWFMFGYIYVKVS